MKRTIFVILLGVLFVISIFILLCGIPQITSNSANLFDAISAIIASIILAIFSGSGLLIILNKRL